MQIELIGSTSAGKTTLARGIVQAARARGLEAMLSDDFVLRQIRLEWLRGHFLRQRLVDLLALLGCLLTCRRHGTYYRFAAAVAFRTPGSWFARLNLVRNTLRKAGVYEIIRRRARDRDVVLVDNDGVLQTVHYLFVHVAAPYRRDELARFLTLAPLPEVAFYLKQPPAVLLDRTLARGHKRVPSHSQEDARRFIERAVEVFDRLAQQPRLQRRLLVIDGRRLGAPEESAQSGTLLTQAFQMAGGDVSADNVNTTSTTRQAPREAVEPHLVHSGGQTR